MRVALVTESFAPDITGTATLTRCMADHLASRGHQPLIIAPAPDAGYDGGAGPYPVAWVPSRTHPRNRAVRVALPSPVVADALREGRPDVVFLLGPIAMGIKAGQQARDLKIPFVTLYLISPSNISGWNRSETGRSAKLEDFFWTMFRDLYNLAEVSLAPTGSAAGELEEHGIQRVRVWEFGVDTERFHPRHRRDRIRSALAPSGELIVGYVGRLSDEKQLELLAETADRPGIRLVLVGHGPDEPRLRSLMPAAYFAGSRQGAALARLYASFDVFVHPGGYETAGLTILEAQASGCAVVVPRSQGAADMVDADRTALVVEPHSGTAIAEAVARLAGDRVLLRGMADAARASAVERSWAAAGDRLIGHFESARRES